MTLSAVGLNVKLRRSAREIEGGITAHDDGIVPLDLQGEIGTLLGSGGFKAAGRRF